MEEGDLRVGTIIAVGSCKGGVGKTTVSVNLALALRRLGHEVGLFDADLYGPNVPIMLGLRNRKDRAPFAFRGGGGETVPFLPLYTSEARSYIEPSRAYGLSIMSLGFWFGESTVARDTSTLGGTLVSEIFSATNWGELDYLIIDLPPGTGELIHSAVTNTRVDSVVVVTTPQDMTLLDTQRSINLFRTMDMDILGRVENMSYHICPRCGERVDIYSTGFDDWEIPRELPLLGTIPLDHIYSRPVDAYHPFTQVSIDTPEAEPFVSCARSVIDRLGSRKS